MLYNEIYVDILLLYPFSLCYWVGGVCINWCDGVM